QVGVETIRKIVRYSSNNGIKALTLYAFSTENWQRPKEEVGFLMDLFRKYFVKETPELCRENVVIKVIGDRSKLDDKLNSIIDDSVEKSKDNTGMILSFAINYGGRDEIVNACNLSVKQANGGEITAEMLEQNLYTKGLPELDLLIRTGGDIRISNFLLWQCAYAEFVFSDVLWPDFSEEDYIAALEEFGKRKRRFGKV
ncbi:MAG: di-trans,poly-cis-decaprenylcistransferase, partial [Clostridia bacterium]|nr:di-trans,poly-cis-decaprenylcistransferase [Clostridia bacterium]